MMGLPMSTTARGLIARNVSVRDTSWQTAPFKAGSIASSGAGSIGDTTFRSTMWGQYAPECPSIALTVLKAMMRSEIIDQFST